MGNSSSSEQSYLFSKSNRVYKLPHSRAKDRFDVNLVQNTSPNKNDEGNANFTSAYEASVDKVILR